MKRSWLWLFTVLFSCGKMSSGPEEEPSRYDLANPTAIFELPGHLGEISGLAWVSENELATVQDESLAVFILDPRNGESHERYSSGISADIEGITWKDGEFWVVESSGYVYRLGKDSLEVFPTRFTHKNNLEGILWDSTAHRFLLTCKGHPGSGQPDDSRAVYAFDSLVNLISETPALIIDAAEIAARPEAEQAMDKLSMKKARHKDKKSREIKQRQIFQPSDLAIHPLSRTMFVLSAATGLLAEYAEDGTLLDLWRLPEKRLPKAEGITFAPDGTLYISSERGCPTCKSSLAVFSMKKTSNTP